MSIANLISLLSGIALFLFGMALMGDGLKKVAGNKLEVILFRLTGSPLKGFLLGTGVTAVIQSSSATSVMVVGFVNSGMMRVRQAISIVMGAILGTSITGWIICLSDLGGGGGWIDLFSTATLTGIISVVGIVLRMFSKSQTKRHIGDILMGFAVLMFGMSAMSGAVSPLRSDPTFLRILTTFSNPMLGILFGTLFTCVLQSASAAVGILQALASTGVIDFSMALPIIMGIAIGAALPVLLSAIGANVDGKRTAMVYLVVEVVGVIFWAAAFYLVNAFVQFDFMSMTMSSVSIAFVNTLFRFVKVVILLPFIDVIEKVVDLLVKDKPVQAEATDETIRLEERFIQHPALAIEQSRITINSMAAEAQENLAEAMRLLHHYSDEGYRTVVEMEQVVDRYEDRLGSYLVKLTGQELSSKQNEDASKFLHTISDFERISDHALNIAQTAKEMREKSIVFSDDALRELAVLESALAEIVHITVNAFIRNDLSLASRVEPLEELIDDLCDELKLHHVDRLQKGHCTLLNGFLFNDLLTNYERVADHCSNIAVAMIELESDSFDTHEYLSSIKEMKSDTYERYYEEYSQQYHL
ncbi:MAG: Na/Pi cotransporter [Clostridia bacterium]|nr:MAG: Na/Pi cotransporter [Clostridia bacterium]